MVGDALAGVLRENPHLLDAVVDIEIQRRVAAGDLLETASLKLPGNLQMVPADRYEQMREALMAAAHAAQDEDLSAVLAALGPYLATDNDGPQDPTPPARKAAAAKKVAPTKKVAAKKTTARKTTAKKAAASKARPEGMPELDGQDHPCEVCEVPVNPVQQQLSHARFGKILCRDHHVAEAQPKAS